MSNESDRPPNGLNAIFYFLYNILDINNNPIIRPGLVEIIKSKYQKYIVLYICVED